MKYGDVVWLPMRKFSTREQMTTGYNTVFNNDETLYHISTYNRLWTQVNRYII